ncbi:MAG TPA: AzlD domain-containing protein [Acidimicrobiales bacterium]|nr:AzlD domain-containing protein [Acidimicrobiales bacterium]
MNRVWIAIVVSGIGTYAMRTGFLVFADRMAAVPEGVQRLLRQIPPAAMASIVIPELLRPEDHVDLWSGELGAGLVAALVAWRTRNTGLTLVVGMVLLFILQQL